MPQIIDGKAISAQIKDELKKKVEVLKETRGISVCLAVIQVGSDPASTVYVGNKKKACAYIGIDSLSYELPEETASQVLVLAKKIAVRMADKLHCDGLNLIQNNGEAAGQTVPHFHLHMIPRYLKDGQKIGWVPGKPTQEELEAVRKQIPE